MPKTLFVADIGAFSRAALDHWKALTGGSLVAILIGIAASMGFNLPPVAVAAVAFGAVVVFACFMAFRDERKKTRDLATRMADLQSHKREAIAIARRRREFMNKLANIMDKGRIILQDLKETRKVNNDAIDDWIVSVYTALAVGAPFDSTFVARFNLASELPCDLPENLPLGIYEAYRLMKCRIMIINDFVKEIAAAESGRTA